MTTKLNGSKYCNVSLIFQFNISPFVYTHLNDKTIQFSIKYSVFVYTQLNVKTVLFQAIQFSISTQVKCQTILFDP